MAGLAVVAVVDPVRFLALAIQGKITIKIPDHWQGQPMRDNIQCCEYVEVSDDLSCEIVLFLMLRVEQFPVNIDPRTNYDASIGHIFVVSTTRIPRRLIKHCKQVT